MKRFFLVIPAIVILCLSLVLISCNDNVYRPSGDTWSVRNMYFRTFDEALSYLMSKTGQSRGLADSDIADNLTISLLRDVKEGAGAIVVPQSFRGRLCIDFCGHEYWFRSDIEYFFEFLGGDRIDVINGKTVIPSDAVSENKALIVNVSTVTVDEHLVDDRRPEPKAVEIGASGKLVINSASDWEDSFMIGGEFDVTGSLVINGGSVNITDIKDVADESLFVITGGTIRNPDRINAVIEQAIEEGGHPENVEQTVVHDLGGWVTTDENVHYRECAFCHEHFEEGPHVFGDWQDDPETGKYRVCSVCGRMENNFHAHALTHFGAREATCTESGNTEYWFCAGCGKFFADEAAQTEISQAQTVIEAKGHDWGEWATVVSATCTTEGLKQRVCVNDSVHIEQEIIPATGHSIVHHAALSATCATSGNIEYWTCQTCGRFFSDAGCMNEISQADTVIAALGHDFSEEWTHGTIDGINCHWHDCSRCDEKGSLKHCTGVYEHDAEGHIRVCSVCDAVLSEKQPHVWSTDVKTRDDGSCYVECTVCGEILEDETAQVSIGDVSYRIGEAAPAGTMTVSVETFLVRVRYMPADGETGITLSCRYLSSGTWSEDLVQEGDGSFVFSYEEDIDYRIVLVAENGTGTTGYEKVVNDSQGI